MLAQVIGGAEAQCGRGRAIGVLGVAGAWCTVVGVIGVTGAGCGAAVIGVVVSEVCCG